MKVSDRDEFEAWAGDKYVLDRQLGRYRASATHFAWEGWKASRATPPQAVPALNPPKVRGYMIMEGGWQDDDTAEWEISDAGLMRAVYQILKDAATQQAVTALTDEQIEQWANGFIRKAAYNRSVAVQIATEAAKWVIAHIEQSNGEKYERNLAGSLAMGATKEVSGAAPQPSPEQAAECSICAADPLLCSRHKMTCEEFERRLAEAYRKYQD